MKSIVAVSLPLLLSLTVPTDGVGLRGFVVGGADADGLICATDTVSDLSPVSSVGDEAAWHYFTSGDGDSLSVAELQGDRWLLFTLRGDSLRHVHTESSREQSSFSVNPLQDGTSPFRAAGRRDMAFLFADSGSVSVSTVSPATVILAESDTVGGCTLTLQTRRFERRRDDMSGIRGHVTETELRWTLPGRLAPLACACKRTVATPGHDSVSTALLTVFPRAMNEGINSDGMNPPAPRSRNIYRTPTGTPGEITFLYDAAERTLTVNAPSGAGVSVCDIMGRVCLSRPLPDGSGLISLSALPPGEYVATVTCGAEHKSLTIILAP